MSPESCLALVSGVVSADFPGSFGSRSIQITPKMAPWVQDLDGYAD